MPKKIIYYIAVILLAIPIFLARGTENLIVVKCFQSAMHNQIEYSTNLSKNKKNMRCEQWAVQVAITDHNANFKLTDTESKDIFYRNIYAAVLDAELKSELSLQILVELGNYQALYSIFNKALDGYDYDKASTTANAMHAMDPEHSSILVAEYYWKEIQESDNATSIIETAISKYPDSKYLEEWWILLGKIKRSQKLWEESLTAYQNSLEINPNNDEAHVEIGRVYYLAYQDLDLALKELHEAIRLQPNKGTAYFVIGELLSKEGYHAEAQPWFQEAISRSPNALDWYIFWGQSAQKAGDLNSARAIYQKVIDDNPDFSTSYYELSWIYYLLGQADLALEAINKAINVNSQKNGTYYLRAGKLYEWAGDIPQAIKFYKQALKLSPNLIEARELLDNLETLPW